MSEFILCVSTDYRKHFKLEPHLSESLLQIIKYSYSAEQIGALPIGASACDKRQLESNSQLS